MQLFVPARAAACASSRCSRARACCQVLVPPLRELEGHIFEQMFRYLWTSVLLDAANSQDAVVTPRPAFAHAGHKVSTQDMAIQRWCDALQVRLVSCDPRMHCALQQCAGCQTEPWREAQVLSDQVV